MATTTLTYLIPRLRIHIGDTDSTAYRYLDDMLELTLVTSVESLQKWWNYRYLLNDSDEVYRNPNIRFLFAEPPVIQRGDIAPIVLMASITLKSGALENLSWSVGAWRDAEISYSNIEGSRAKREGWQRDLDLLKDILKPPQKRLAQSEKGHLPGYLENEFEIGQKELKDRDRNPTTR